MIPDFMQAGRTINPIDLNKLAESYKRKIYNAITFLINNICVFDFDGTLTNFKYAKNRLLPCMDSQLQKWCETHNLYENVEILKTMQYIINELNEDDVYILTSTVPSLRENKNKCIHANFPHIKDGHIIHTNGAAEKMEILEKIYNERRRQIIFIEDLYKTLLDEEERFDFVKGFHLSSLLP